MHTSPLSSDPYQSSVLSVLCPFRSNLSRGKHEATCRDPTCEHMKRAGKHVWSVKGNTCHMPREHMPREHMPRANMYPCRTRQVSSLCKACRHMSARQQRLQCMWSSVCYTLLYERCWTCCGEGMNGAALPLNPCAPLLLCVNLLHISRCRGDVGVSSVGVSCI